MLTHYIKVAFRNLLKYKVQSIICILGVSIGLVGFIFGYQWLKYETSFDGFHPRSSDMYMISSIETKTGKRSQQLPFALISALKQDFPEVEEVIPIYGRYGSSMKEGERTLVDPEEVFIDEIFLNYFTPQYICGQNTNLMKSAEDLLITKSYAISQWGTVENALNKKVIDAYKNTMQVVAVIEDYPENSLFHEKNAFRTDIFSRQFAERTPEHLKWIQREVEIYICLNKKADKKSFEAKLTDYLIKHELNSELILEAIPLTATRHTFGTDHSFNINYIRTFAITTLILLVCVFLNFINLWANRTNRRIKEIRLRHYVGARKKSIIYQLLIELILQFILILLLSCCMIELLLPLFMRFFDIKVSMNDLWMNFSIAYLIGLATVVLLSLPLLLFFTRWSTLRLSGGIQAHHFAMIRKTSMVSQIGICIAFIFCTLCIGHQVYHMMNKDLGFNKEDLIFFLMTNRDREATVREIEKVPAITRLTSAGIFGYSHEPRTINHVEWEGKPDDYRPNFQLIEADKEFFETIGLSFTNGLTNETPSSGMEQIPMEGKSVMVNEEAMRVIGVDDLVGKKIKIFSGAIHDGVYLMDEVTVAGVVKDFQSASLRHPVLPQIIRHSPFRYSGYCYFARVPRGMEEEAKTQIYNAFKKQALDVDPEPKIQTMNEIWAELHKSEIETFRLFSLLAILSVIISLFGIYSISYSNMERRKKEIAIRKVMGGSTKNITGMFIREYITISLLANLLFIPFAWYFINQWLDQFPGKASVGWMEIMLVILLSCILIILTVLGQILKVSSGNPAEVVKSE